MNEKATYKEISLYDPVTGEITGYVSGHPDQTALNVPKHRRAIDGIHDHRFRKVDIATGKVVDHRPQKPSENHEWHEGIGWTLKPQGQS